MMFEGGSFRDRESRVFYEEDRVLRLLSTAALANWEQLSRTSFYRDGTAAGSIVKTSSLGEHDAVDGDRWQAALEHERIPFVTYPYEWSFSMLKDAALLQLQLTTDALNEGMTLKDASAYNVQWKGSVPCFIDIPSFVPQRPSEPWVGYRQFCELFLFPLLIQAHKGIAFNQLLRGRVDGIEPGLANAFFSFLDRFRSGVFKHVYLQNKLSRRYAGTQRDVKNDLHKAGFNKELILANLRNLSKLIAGLTWNPGGTEWAEYTDFHNYSDDDHTAKMAFVQKVVVDRQPGLVWDIGANTGQFSRIAAKSAEYVLAADIDPGAVERHYVSLRQDDIANVLPIVFNLADPSPDWGWQGVERKSLENRGKPDLILCLALIHHVVIGANIPLREFLKWLSRATAKIVIEFVDREDEQVKKLLRNKDDQYLDYDLDYFEGALGEHFDVTAREALNSGNRYLYYCSIRS